jgi:hypothetical protein
VIFFTDENIPRNIAYMLSYFETNHEVRAYLDYFPKGVPDTQWMSTIAKWNEKIVAICADGRILKNKVEKQVLKECGFTFVYLASGWTNIKWFDYGWKIIKVWPDIVKNAEEANYPMVFEVKVSSLKIQSYGLIQNL